MKRSSFLLLLLVIPVLSYGDSRIQGPNAGGVLLVHNPSLAYTTDSSSYCGVSPITACSQASAELDGSGKTSIKVWKVYAAFPAGSSPRVLGLTWGITYTNVTIGAGSGPSGYYGGCGDRDVPDTGWPGSGVGDFVGWNSPQTTTLVEIYWFAGYGSTGGTFVLGPDPLLGGEFTDDSLPANTDNIYAYGTLGFGVAGSNKCPAPIGACCIPGTACKLLTETDCAAAGGTYQGDLSNCGPVSPCPGACCHPNGACTQETQDDCTNLGGLSWSEDQPCLEPNSCQPQGACCQGQTCTVMNENDCITGGNNFVGGFCSNPNPCVNTAVERTTWGQVKSIFR